MAMVLIIEDQERVARAIALLLELDGIDSRTVNDPEAALAELGKGDVDLVIQDMNFTPGATSGTEGLELFRQLRRLDGELPILLITAWASVANAVELMREGASDYIEKPWDDDKLMLRVRQLLRLRQLERENAQLHEGHRRARTALAERYDLCGLVYASAAMHEVVALAVRVAPADVPVLITGANGTGKEKLAEVIQANSRRHAAPFVKVNAGALPESLIEAELFGAEAGAFTGATKRRIGRFEAANGGTLLLDEIGNLSAAGQTKLLRVLQTGEFERVGSSTSKRADVRVLAATNSDLHQAIDDGEFREDLLFRLNVIEIRVPPLAERRDDILPLVRHFLAQVTTSDRLLRLSEAASQALRSHPWPGNVRQLHNCIQRASLVATSDEIEIDDLGLEPATQGTLRTPAAVRRRATAEAREPDFDHQQLDEHDLDERRRIEAVLLEYGGVVSRAAERLGLSRQAVYRRMERLGIVLERRPRGS